MLLCCDIPLSCPFTTLAFMRMGFMEVSRAVCRCLLPNALLCALGSAAIFRSPAQSGALWVYCWVDFFRCRVEVEALNSSSYDRLRMFTHLLRLGDSVRVRVSTCTCRIVCFSVFSALSCTPKLGVSQVLGAELRSSS